MSCPWAKIKAPEPVNFQEIISEQVAIDLQEKEQQKYLDLLQKNDILENEATGISDSPKEVLDFEDSSVSDELIARMLQMQFDKQFDELLKREEKHFNGTSKISVSFDNYLRTPLNEDFESDIEEDEIVDVIDRKDWDRFDNLQRQISSLPQCGYKMQDGKMLTKHDVVMSGRKNACKLLSFPPEFQTGDGEMMDLKLSNKVFNSLKKHSKHEQTKRHRMRDKKEDRATAEFGVDEFTRLLVYKLINNQILERVNGVISIGKEAVILHAESDLTNPNINGTPPPKECVLKIFKTTLSEFKQRVNYINDDHRFKDRIGKQTSRQTINLWAEKEMSNLMRVRRAGIPCPEVVSLKNHVLVMSFIGQDHLPAPKLKDAHLQDVDYILAYDEVTEGMKKLYEDANLIHADLSEYNILWHNNQCYFIDVSQAVEPSHSNAFFYLFRDCVNIINFFNKKGVPEIYSPEELFKFVTGCDFSDKVALQKAIKMKPHLVDSFGLDVDDKFEINWQKARDGDLPPIEKIIPDIDVTLVKPVRA